MKLVSTMMLVLMMSAAAQATPGDIGCSGQNGSEKIDVLIGYDHFNEGPSLLSIAANEKDLFSSTQVQEGMINVGTKENPFIINQTYAESAETGSIAQINWPEQEPSEDGSFEGVLTLAINGKDRLVSVEIKCER